MRRWCLNETIEKERQVSTWSPNFKVVDADAAAAADDDDADADADVNYFKISSW